MMQEEIRTIISEIDIDNNGEIDFEEFVAVMSRKVNATYTPEEVKNSFKVHADKHMNNAPLVRDDMRL